MDVRSPFFQNIATLLIGVLFLNPIVSTAADLAVDAAAGGNTGIAAAGNGVPVVNIATPNSKGLSHNTFRDYNVGQQGLILNNSAQALVQSQLGGYIVGNSNLKNGAANVILNEVTGSNQSRLNGYTEVAGQSAHVIVANPNGISCDGCGFINTPRATLTTGKPVIENGRLDRFDVDGGEIAIEGEGLNASNLDQFDLITRSATLNASLYANQLNVITGRNEVKADDLATTAKADDGSSKPQLAIDSSALGGMYAGAIRLVGTEAGVGVRLAGDMAASAGDIQIDANGHLSLAQTGAAGSLRAKAQDITLNGPAYASDVAELNASGQLSNSGSLAAGQRVALTAAQISNSGIVEAGVNSDDSRNVQGDVAISTQNLRNSGSVVASRNLEANASGTLDNQGGALKGADTRVTATTLDNRQGRLLAGDQLSLNAASLDNRNGQAVASRLQVSGGALDNRLGRIEAEQSLDFTLDSLDNSGQGTLVSNGTLQARVQQTLDNQADGLFSAKGALGVQAGDLDNRGGLVVGDAGVTLSAASLDNSMLGVIGSLGELKIDVGQLDNSQGGALDSGAALRLTASQVNNIQGSVNAKGDLQAKADSFSQQGGELLAQGALNLEAGQLDNRSGGLVAANNGVTVKGTDLLNQGGEISSRAKVDVQAASLDNATGKVIGDAGLDVQVQHIANRAGTLAGRDGLSITGQSLDNSQGGQLSSQKSLWLQLTGALDNSSNGALLSQGTLTLDAGSLDNRAGTVSSAGLLFSRLAGTLNNQGGKLLSDAAIDLAGANLNNASGIISAADDISLQGATLDNSQNGRIVTDAAIHLATAQLDNHQGGSLSARGAIDGSVTGLDQHGGGQLIGQGGIDLDLQGGALNNAGGLLGSPGQLVLRNVASLDNQGGEISSDRAFALTTGTLLNQGGKLISGDRLGLTTGALNNSSAGVLSGTNGLSVSAASLDNSLGGTLASRGDLLVHSQGTLDNHDDGALVAGGKLDVGSASLNNQGGLLSAMADLELATGSTDNRDGRLLAQGRLDGTTADLDNRDGVISGAQGLDLAAGDVLNGASVAGNPGGLITSQGALTLRGGKLESTGGGEVSAKGDLHLIVAQLIQRQAALIGEGKVTLDLGSDAQRGDFDNRSGLLSAGGLLAINGLGNLDNRGGEISASQGFTLDASGALDNGDGGRIISAGQLELNAADLRNANQGLLSGWQGLVVNAASLDNSSGGTVSSRDGALTLTLSGALDNHGEGALVSKGTLSLGAGSLNNAGGVVSTQGNLGLTLAGDLDNSAAGLLSTQGSLTGKSGAVDNHVGQISAASIDYDASSLNNSGGSLVSQGALRLGLLGALLNNGAGSKLASGGALNLNVGSLENRAGQLASQGLLKVLAGRFDNSLGGTVAAQNDLTLDLSAELLNGQDGLIFSKAGQLDVSASSIANAGGTLQGQGDTALSTTGALDNQNGRIISQNGQLDLGSGGLDNSAGGVINAANGNLELVTGNFSNNAGTTQAKALDITASGGIDNRAGHLSAVSGDNRINTTDLNNQGGGLYASNLFYLRGNQLLNDGAALGQGGKIGAGNIDASLSDALNNQFGLIESTDSLTLGVASINNLEGAIRALGQDGTTQIGTSGLLNNDLGRIESAAQNLNLQAGSLQNGGGNVLHVGTGTFGVDLAQAGQAGGSFITNGSLTYQADNWSNNAIIQARNLDLDIGQLNLLDGAQILAAQSFIGRGGNWSNEGVIASDGTLELNLSGSYTAGGRLSSLGALSLAAGYIGIGQSGSIGGGGATALINSSGTLDNSGRLTATQALRVDAAGLNNLGTLGSADDLYLGATTLLNENGLIFSGGNMQLRTQEFTNRNADLYSLGTLHIAANDQDGWASSVQNISGSFESAGAMTLLVQDFDNRRADDFEIGERIVSGSIQFRYDDVCDGNGCEVHFLSQERSEDVILKDAPQASITAGGDFHFIGDSFDNLYSSIGSGGNIDIQTATFRNQGAAGGVERHYNAEFYTRNDNRYWTFRANKDLYNRYNDATSPDYDPGHLTRQQVFDSAGYPTGFFNITTSEVAVSGTPAAAAAIQATGDVVINASQSFDNSVVKRDAGAQTISPRDVGVANGATTVQLAITSQLPPDLAQQQVNPVTLPGFTLPQGESGLFRLNGQGGSGGSTDTVQSVGDLGFSGQAIGAAQREENLGGGTAGAGNVVLGDNPTSTGAQPSGALDVPRVQGLPSSATPSNSHKYLIETNPELTSLKSFLSSDYLLTNLGYDPDTAQKRLGDGLYEQRLIQQAVVARTGQRYIDGMASDEALFQYLMDNAIAYKDSLQLTVGMALSAEQVAALTHDIVWLEDAVVNGEKVLVPVLYLAQADGRLAANGALIMGGDVSLISGGELNNAGSLRASGELSATAANIGNSGLIEAGERLDLLATDSIRNTAGGIISGRDVSLSAMTGDVINQRNITSVDVSNDAHRIHEEIANNAARIEARGDLAITAGRDLTNTGSVIQAGGDADLSAGRDLRLDAAQEADSFDFQSRRVTGNVSSVTQHGSDVQVGGNLELSAGRDLNAVASRIDAASDIALSAGRDVVLASAANEEHSDAKYTGGGKRIDTQDDQVVQQVSVIKAGGDLDIAANNDLTVSSSQLQAGNEAYLYAGGDIRLEAAQNEDYSYSYKMKKSRGFLSSSKKSKLTEQTQITNVGSTITSQGDAVLIAKNDIRVMGSTIESDAADVSLVAGNDVQIGAVSDLTQRLQNQKSSKTSWGGFKSGKAANDVSETSTQVVGSLISGDNVSIQAARDAQVTGSSVVGTHDVELVAGRDLKVDAATKTFNREEKYKVKSRDFTGILTGNNLGLDDITGKQHLSISNGKGNSSAAETTLSGSTIGSSEGSVSLTAGRKLDIIASDLVSTKDLALTGSDVTIAAGIETAKQSSKDSSSSLAVGRVIGGQTVDTAKSIRNDLQAARDADDGRLKAVKLAQAGLSAYNAYNTGDTAAANISEGKPANSSGSLIKIGTEVASTHSKSMSEYSSETAKQASLLSGGSLSIVATGANTEGDIHVVGSSLTAEDTLLAAKRNITLESAQNSAEWENKNSTNRVSVGASFNIGQQNGFTIDLGAQAAKGKGTGNSVEQVNSSLDTGTLILRSGQDTTVAGAQVHAETLNAQIGGNLNIASRQDEESSKNKQVSGGVGMSICVPPICYGSTVSGSANIAASKTDSTYEAVMDQSGLFAGKGGYNIIVGKTTDLHGAVIASEASADKNLLSTDRLTVSDIKNRSELTSQAASISASYSSNGTTKNDGPTNGSSGMGGGIPLQLTENDHSATRSAVSEGTITVRSADGANDLVGLNRDTANANQALDKPDQKAMQERMDLIQSTAELGESIANTVAAAKQKEASEKASKAKTDDEIKAAVAAQNEADAWKAGGDKRVIADVMTGLVAAGLGGTNSGTAVGIVANTTAADTFNAIGNYAAKKKLEAESSGDTAMAAAWAEGGAARVLLHALAGAVQGLAGGNAGSGALGAGASAALMPSIAEALETSGLSETDQNALAALVAAGVGAIAASGTDLGGQIAAGGSAAGVDLYNRQLHPDEIVFLSNQERVNRYIAYIKAQKGETLTPEEALKALNQSGAALADLEWEQVRSGDALTIMFIQQEAAAAGGGYLDADGSLHPLFAVSHEEYLDERINLKALFDSYGKTAATSQYLDDNVVTSNSWAERFRAGQEQGQIDAGKGYEGATGVAGGLAADVGAIFMGFGSIPDALWGEKSDEIGPIDSERMSSYYQALLHLQDRAKEAGYASEFEWDTAQRQGVVGLAVGELTGLALLKAVKAATPKSTGAEATLPVATDLGTVSFDAANGVGTIYSPKVTMNAGEVIFDDFAVGTSKGFMGYGPDGASELVGPLKKLLEYTQSQGAKTVTLKGYYASEEGAALGGGKVGEKFSFSFPATKEGLRDFLKGLK